MAKKFDFRVILDRLSQVSLDPASLQKYAWVLHLFIIFILAKSASNLVVSYIDNKIQAPIKVAKTQKQDRGSHSERYPRQDEFKVINKRNIFNPFAKDEDESTTQDSGATQPKLGLDEQSATPSSLPFELVGTIILSDPKKSIAAVKDKGKKQTESYTIDEIIGGKAKIFKVDPLRVYFENMDAGAMEYIEIKEDTKVASTSMAAPPRSGSGGIRQAGDDNFVIDRSALESTLANPNEILTQARAVPNIVGGKIKGFRIFSIKPGSLYSKLGIRNGDVIERVNGVDMDSPSKALEFYGAITQATDISLDIIRGGKKRSFKYQIR